MVAVGAVVEEALVVFVLAVEADVSFSLANFSVMIASPLRRWQSMAKMDSDILSPCTFSGFLSHKWEMHSKAR